MSHFSRSKANNETQVTNKQGSCSHYQARFYQRCFHWLYPDKSCNENSTSCHQGYEGTKYVDVKQTGDSLFVAPDNQKPNDKIDYTNNDSKPSSFRVQRRLLFWAVKHSIHISLAIEIITIDFLTEEQVDIIREKLPSIDKSKEDNKKNTSQQLNEAQQTCCVSQWNTTKRSFTANCFKQSHFHSCNVIITNKTDFQKLTDLSTKIRRFFLTYYLILC